MGGESPVYARQTQMRRIKIQYYIIAEKQNPVKPLTKKSGDPPQKRETARKFCCFVRAQYPKCKSSDSSALTQSSTSIVRKSLNVSRMTTFAMPALMTARLHMAQQLAFGV